MSRVLLMGMIIGLAGCLDVPAPELAEPFDRGSAGQGGDAAVDMERPVDAAAPDARVEPDRGPELDAAPPDGELDAATLDGGLDAALPDAEVDAAPDATVGPDAWLPPPLADGELLLEWRDGEVVLNAGTAARVQLEVPIEPALAEPETIALVLHNPQGVNVPIQRVFIEGEGTGWALVPAERSWAIAPGNSMIIRVRWTPRLGLDRATIWAGPEGHEVGTELLALGAREALVATGGRRRMIFATPALDDGQPIDGLVSHGLVDVACGGRCAVDMALATGRCVAVGADEATGGPLIVVSHTAERAGWRQVAGLPDDMPTLRSIAWSERWYALDTLDGIWVSDDAERWDRVGTLGAGTGAYRDLAAGAGVLVAVSDEGVSAWREAAERVFHFESWPEVIGEDPALEQVIFGGDRFVAIGERSAIYSVDGGQVSMREVARVGDQSLRSIAFGALGGAPPEFFGGTGSRTFELGQLGWADIDRDFDVEGPGPMVFAFEQLVTARLGDVQAIHTRTDGAFPWIRGIDAPGIAALAVGAHCSTPPPAD